MKNNTIILNGGIINTGSGNVANNESTNVVSKNPMSSEDKKQLNQILIEIDKIASILQKSADYEEVLRDIKDELQKAVPSKNLLKRCFQLIPSFIKGVTEGVVANNLSELVSTALSLLEPIY